MNDVVLNVKYKKQYWKIALKNKITNIIGDSATGKSTLAIACSEESSDIARVSVVGPKKKYSVITSYNIPRYVNVEELIESRADAIFIIDEDHIKRFKSDEVAKAIVKSSNYFVYIGRVKLSNMNIDLDSVGSLREYNGILQLEPYKREMGILSKY